MCVNVKYLLDFIILYEIGDICLIFLMVIWNLMLICCIIDNLLHVV